MFFELDDIKRRHSLYWDLYNVESWVTAPDNTLSWNYQRGAIAGVTAALFQETWINFQENWRLLATKYEPPSNLRQVGIYVKEILRSDNFRLAAKNRSQYAITSGVTDLAVRVAAYRWIMNGWQRPYGGFETNHVRKIPGAVLAALITAPTSIPFEVARMTYYADKTFPRELQRGYTSYLNALFRIPFEEGPYWLFKNSFPFFLRNFFQTLTAFYSYDFLKDKLSFIWRVGDVPYLPVKIFNCAFSSWMACVFSYPWAVTVRQMVDFWPKPADGKTPWDNNYRKASVWLWYQETSNVMFPGLFNNYFWRTFPMLFSLLYVADNFGIFTYQVVDLFSGQGTNTWEDSFS